MTDEATLRAHYRTLVITCVAVTAVPFILAFVAFMMDMTAEEGRSAGTDPVLLVVFGLLALSPLVTAPLIRRLSMRPGALAAQQNSTPATAALTFWLAEYAAWEISSLLGFVGYVMTGSTVFFAACAVLSLAGFAMTFPRWSAWVDRVEALERMNQPSIISG